ncbi:unnamed protein product [Larinioides sclopetarius]|uniref:non-specific serine/threonine protein kinase n=1 Tax=Larinioides sclopetarius TaxID=280406 RepID=A0AAV1ZKJ7_9ARAC
MEKQKGAKRYQKIDSSSSKKHKSGINPKIIQPIKAQLDVVRSFPKEKIARKPLTLRFVTSLPDLTLLSSKKSDHPMNTTQVCTPELLHAPETEASTTTRVRTLEIPRTLNTEILEWQFSEPSTRVNQTTNFTMGESMLQTGHVVKDKWQVVSKIGQGAFGEVYKCKEFTSNRQVALKLVSKERVTSATEHQQCHLLKLEVTVLKELQGKHYFPKFVGFGKTERFDYLVMELLGPSLRELKKHQPDRKFSLSTTLRLGHMMLKCIHSIHKAGYLHRDIKPSNFTIGIGEDNRRRVYLLDFGLARQYVLESGEVRPPRYKVSFHGTPRYASLRVLQGKEAGRQDDLMSLFYALSEFSFRDLPWKNIRDYREMAQAKEVFDHQILVKEFPDEFQDFYNHISGLTFFDKPDYDLLYSVFDRCIKQRGVKETDPFDFEENGGQPTESHLRKDNTSSVPTKRRRYRRAATSLASIS